MSRLKSFGWDQLAGITWIGYQDWDHLAVMTWLGYRLRSPVGNHLARMAETTWLGYPGRDYCPGAGKRRNSNFWFPTKSRFHYINIPHNLFIQIDMTLNFIFHLGFSGNAFIKVPKIHPNFGARSAPNLGRIFGTVINACPETPRWTIKFRVTSIWINRLWSPFVEYNFNFQGNRAE